MEEMLNKNGSLNTMGFFRGEVIRYETHGFCRIWIPGIYPSIFREEPDKLPPAEQASPIFAGSKDGDGVFGYPAIGSMVWCFFQNGDIEYPVYFATTLAKSSSDIQFSNLKSDGVVKMCGDNGMIEARDVEHINIGNITIKLNTIDNAIDISTIKKDDKDEQSYIRLAQNGDITISAKDRLLLKANDIDIQSKNNISLYSPNDVHIKTLHNTAIEAGGVDIHTKLTVNGTKILGSGIISIKDSSKSEKKLAKERAAGGFKYGR